MSFIKDSIKEALNESLEVIGQFGNKTLLLADEFDGRTYMVMDDYIDEDHPGRHDRSFISKDEAIHYLMSSNINESLADEFFTREEIDDFSYDLVDDLYNDYYAYKESSSIKNDISNSEEMFRYISSYLDNGYLEVTIEWDGFFEETVSIKIDMRKIKNPSDLKRYSPLFIKEFKAKFKEDGASFNESFSESIKCDRCGSPIEGDGFASKENPSGILCDACYHDMYGVNEGLENNGPNNTKWKDIDGDWYPETYADGYESLKGLDIPQDVLDYMDKWFGFETIVGQTPDGQIMLSDGDGNYELYDNVENFVADMKYSIEQTQDLDESVIPATDVVVRNASGELSRQAVSSTEELGKYLMSMVDALEAGDTISLEIIDFMESLNKLVESLDEDVDSEDNALIRSAYKKIDGKQSNMKLLTPEEKDALKRNGLDAWAWGKETKIVSPNNNDIIGGRINDRYYSMRNGHYKKDLDLDKVDLVDRAAKMDARDANQDIKTGPIDNYQKMNRRYDDNKMQEPVHKMKSALLTRKRYQNELDDADIDFRDREAKNSYRFNKDVSDTETMHFDTDKELNKRLDNDNARIQALLDKHKRESLELIEDYLLKLDEAEISDEDKRDNELIRSAQMKLAGRRNARLSNEEHDALRRHNLTPYGNFIYMNSGSQRSLPSGEKINLAGLADKNPERHQHNVDLQLADYTNSANRNEKNYSTKYSWERNQQDKERALDAARMGKDYDEMNRLVRDRRHIKNEIADNDAERLDNWNKAVQRRDAETERNKARLMRIKDENPAKIAKAQTEIDSLLRKNESLKEEIITERKALFKSNGNFSGEYKVVVIDGESNKFKDVGLDILGISDEKSFLKTIQRCRTSKDVLKTLKKFADRKFDWSISNEFEKSVQLDSPVPDSPERAVRAIFFTHEGGSKNIQGYAFGDKLYKSPKTESLTEAFEDRIIYTGLENNKVNNEILRSVIGQMSDGIWENSPGMEKYWYPLEIDGTNIVINSSKYNTYDEMSDSEVKRFFANKIKRIAQEFLNDNNMNPFNGFSKDNETPCNYLNYEETITIGDAYRAYEKLK